MNAFRSDYKRLNTKFLCVDELYQREIDPKRVNKIVKQFDPNLVNPVKASFRDGKYWVIDGHHTMMAQILKNGGKDLYVDCKVFYGMTWLDEVKYFLKQNGELSRAINVNDRFRAMMNSGDPDISKMVKLAEKAGFTIDFKGAKGKNKIVALSTLFKVYSGLTEQEYFDYLCLLKRTWGGAPDSLSREILQGVYIFCKTYKGLFSPKTFESRLKKVAPYEIIRDGRSSLSTGATKYARQILGRYNYHAKERLPDLL